MAPSHPNLRHAFPVRIPRWSLGLERITLGTRNNSRLRKMREPGERLKTREKRSKMTMRSDDFIIYH
jgi:hypothetical protein